MITLCSELKSIRKVINFYRLLGGVVLVCALFLVSPIVRGQDMAWPQFRGPNSNPVGAHARLAERWSKTENVEWAQEIPGRAWSSPIVTGGKVYVTTVTTEGKSKPPQIGTEYSNEYVAELLRTEIVAVGPDEVVSYDLQGKELWRMSRMAATPVPTPFAYEGLLYINGGRGRPWLMRELCTR